MASGDARPIPKKNVAYRVTFPILDADGDLVSSAAGLDSEVSKDGAAFADCTSEATEIGSSGIYYLDLTATEMNADTVAIIVKTTTTGAKTTPIVLYPVEAGDIPVNLTQWLGTAPLALTSQLVQTQGNQLGAQAKADVNAEADTALSDAGVADPPTMAEMDTAHALLATEAKQDTIDTVVDAIKAVTDNLPDSGALSALAAILEDTGTTLPAEHVALDALLDTIIAGLVTIDTEIGVIDGIADAILADTNELQGDDVPALIAALNDPAAAAIADAIWDETRSGHLGDGSFGGILQAPVSGTASGGGTSPAHYIDLGVAASPYVYDMINIIDGTGAGQARLIVSAVSNNAFVLPNWTTTPDNTSKYVVLPVGPAIMLGFGNAGAGGLADLIMQRTTASVESSYPSVSHRSLYGVAAALGHKREIIAGPKIRLYKADDSTTLIDIDITEDSGQDPISALDPPA